MPLPFNTAVLTLSKPFKDFNYQMNSHNPELDKEIEAQFPGCTWMIGVYDGLVDFDISGPNDYFVCSKYSDKRSTFRLDTGWLAEPGK